LAARAALVRWIHGPAMGFLRTHPEGMGLRRSGSSRGSLSRATATGLQLHRSVEGRRVHALGCRDVAGDESRQDRDLDRERCIARLLVQHRRDGTDVPRLQWLRVSYPDPADCARARAVVRELFQVRAREYLIDGRPASCGRFGPGGATDPGFEVAPAGSFDEPSFTRAFRPCMLRHSVFRSVCGPAPPPVRQAGPGAEWGASAYHAASQAPCSARQVAVVIETRESTRSRRNP